MKNNLVKYGRVIGAIGPFVVSAFAVSFAWADAIPAPPAAPQTRNQLEAVLCNVTAYFFWIVIIVSIIMVLFAAFTYVTAGDNTEKTTRARSTLTYAALGIIIALIAYGFPAVISGFVSTANGFSFQCNTG